MAFRNPQIKGPIYSLIFLLYFAPFVLEAFKDERIIPKTITNIIRKYYTYEINYIFLQDTLNKIKKTYFQGQIYLKTFEYLNMEYGNLSDKNIDKVSHNEKLRIMKNLRDLYNLKDLLREIFYFSFRENQYIAYSRHIPPHNKLLIRPDKCRINIPKDIKIDLEELFNISWRDISLIILYGKNPNELFQILENIFSSLNKDIDINLLDELNKIKMIFENDPNLIILVESHLMKKRKKSLFEMIRNNIVTLIGIALAIFGLILTVFGLANVWNSLMSAWSFLIEYLSPIIQSILELGDMIWKI